MSTLTQADLQSVQQLLQSGRVPEAAAACRDLLKKNPNALPLHQLLGMALQRLGDAAGAEQAFRCASALAPDNVDLIVAHASALRRAGRPAQAEKRLRKATAIAPRHPGAWHALGLLLFSGGQLEEAQRCARRVTEVDARNAAGWELLAAVLQKRDRAAEAIATCREGLARVPRAPRLHYSLAQLLRQECEFEAAAAAYAAAQRAGFDTPELYRNRGEALLDAGDTSAALACAQSGVKRFPGHAPLQRTAARLHHVAGAAGDPLDLLWTTARANPAQPDLWQTLVELLRRLDRKDEAAGALVEARRSGCPDSPGLLLLEAQEQARGGDNAAATRAFEKLLQRYPDDRNISSNFAMHLLTADDPAYAARICESILSTHPHDQLALTYLGTAWQLLDDPREHWLLDYETMVRPVEVAAPDGYADRDQFFRELRDALEDLHKTTAHPIEQSVRGGTQTNGYLFRLKHPLLRTLEKQLRLAIVSAINDFPQDDAHPFWSRRHRTPTGDGLRFAGAWSVRLRGQGYHTNHMHPQGWVSSAFYVHLPEEVRRGNDDSGFIQFGQPMKELGIDVPPRRVVKPEIGTLVLFPSYMWHGTVPFESEEPRITVAFDLLPEV